MVLMMTIAAATACVPSCGGDEDNGAPERKRQQTRPAATGEAPTASNGLVKIELVLPQPRFAGTPKNIPPGTTVEVRKGPRPPLMAPEGTTNVALGKPVTASDDEPIIGEVSVITDGDKEAVEGSYVEFGPGTQYVQIDLGKTYEIHAVVVWHYHGDPRVYRDVVVRVGDDPDFITYQTIFNNDHDSSSGLGVGTDREYFETFEGKLIRAGGVRGRYVRLYSRGSTADEMNHYTEVEVYGLGLRQE